ncbi:unnamed protein product [Adineta steineri]|uniref:Uncharacterized protein n=1 Tax=Adineta steineri TaxID=433720 RepID=A0A819PCZ9_9BILA|nr:unnamed protein product [Adineta steineri]CAF1282300.1 unnamed protein product [Adineta steineri]CAF3971898.1 unnamed protein product [Adineta steineri]CAF4013051.1 unnamed protein product [Adineta steineri]
MGLFSTAADGTLKKRYAELAEKTAKAMASEGPPPNINDRPIIPNSLPPLPRYELATTAMLLLIQRSPAVG